MPACVGGKRECDNLAREDVDVSTTLLRNAVA